MEIVNKRFLEGRNELFVARGFFEHRETVANMTFLAKVGFGRLEFKFEMLKDAVVYGYIQRLAAIPFPLRLFSL